MQEDKSGVFSEHNIYTVYHDISHNIANCGITCVIRDGHWQLNSDRLTHNWQ